MAPTPQVQKTPDVVTREEFEFQANQLSSLMKANKLQGSQIEFMKHSHEMQKGMKPSFIMPETSKTFDDMLAESGFTSEEWFNEVSENLAREKGVQGPALHSMQKSLSESARLKTAEKDMMTNHPEISAQLAKSWGTPEYENVLSMNKAILGDPADPSAPGSWFTFLEENLSPDIQRIIFERQDATAMMSVPTAITTSVNPEVGKLVSGGSGWGKHSLGFPEGDTADFGGQEVSERIFSKLYQKGVRARVTEYLIGNQQKMLTRDPIAYERELRLLEFVLGCNHQIMYGDPTINKRGSVELEMPGILYQMDRDESDNGYRPHVQDWNGKTFSDTPANNPLNIFRQVGEDLCINGRIAGNNITGRYKVLIDLSTSNLISTLVDDKQRIMIENYAKIAQEWGQSFTGFVTDVGTFNWQRSKTMDLTENDTWTPTERISDFAIVWPTITETAVPTSPSGEPKTLPNANYVYKVTAVNDQAESNVSNSFTNAVATSTQQITINIPYDAAFAGGVVGGKVITPCRHFNLYRLRAGEADVTENYSCIAKIAINGTSTTTYVDYNQKMPGMADMFFISNDPRDIAYTSLVPEFEIPLYDISKGSTRQWMLYCIKGLNLWNPKRCYVVRNVPKFSTSSINPWA
jgi:hypothetical protein